jgi:hypothetical protein
MEFGSVAFTSCFRLIKPICSSLLTTVLELVGLFNAGKGGIAWRVKETGGEDAVVLMLLVTDGEIVPAEVEEPFMFRVEYLLASAPRMLREAKAGSGGISPIGVLMDRILAEEGAREREIIEGEGGGISTLLALEPLTFLAALGRILKYELSTTGATAAASGAFLGVWLLLGVPV